MKYLIVNADDYGLDENINQAVIMAYSQGIVRSTTILANGEAFFSGISALKENPGLGVGVHLTLVNGYPLSSTEEIPSLLNEEGKFYRSYQELIPRFLTGRIKLREIKNEWAKQISLVLDQGLVVTHLDSHQHLHVLPGIQKVVGELARDFHIQKIRLPHEKMMFLGGSVPALGRLLARDMLSGVSALSKFHFSKQNLKYPQQFYGMLWGGHLSENRLITILQRLPVGISEIMTHPGLSSQVLEQKFLWGYNWEEELAALTSFKVKTIVEQQQIQLVNYHSL